MCNQHKSFCTMDSQNSSPIFIQNCLSSNPHPFCGPLAVPASQIADQISRPGLDVRNPIISLPHDVKSKQYHKLWCFYCIVSDDNSLLMYAIQHEAYSFELRKKIDRMNTELDEIPATKRHRGLVEWPGQSRLQKCLQADRRPAGYLSPRMPVIQQRHITARGNRWINVCPILGTKETRCSGRGLEECRCLALRRDQVEGVVDVVVEPRLVRMMMTVVRRQTPPTGMNPTMALNCGVC